eukprot:GHVR01187085.1.p1 GENE.GHVR01187085.1~~GHVR01187085.1.p1  ORF type:complete len:101 (+),score=6.44 GHVR01187085.1:627-929(+)
MKLLSGQVTAKTNNELLNSTNYELNFKNIDHFYNSIQVTLLLITSFTAADTSSEQAFHLIRNSFETTFKMVDISLTSFSIRYHQTLIKAWVQVIDNLLAK